LILGVVPLLLIAEQGRDWGWGSGRALACYLVGALGLALFLLAERRIGDDALLPLRFFRIRTFSIGAIIGVVIGMAMFGGIVVLPLYLQIVKGASPVRAGLLLLPATLGIMVGSLISGQFISRTGRYKIFPVVGAVLMVIGLVLLHSVRYDTSLWQTSLYMAIFGLGLGGNLQPLILAVQNAMPPQDIGVATSSVTFFRQMGGTLGTAVFLSILFSTLTGNIGSAFRDASITPQFQAALHNPAVLANPDNAAVLRALDSGAGAAGGDALTDSSFIQRLDPRLAKPFLVGFSQSMDTVFLVVAVVALVGLLLNMALPELPLSQQSGLQRIAAEAQAEAQARAAAAVPADVSAGGQAADPAGPEPPAPDGQAAGDPEARARETPVD
jgi:hypothetical protein